jgi:alpha-tubulin suppressor-like RCC1 family protein
MGVAGGLMPLSLACPRSFSLVAILLSLLGAAACGSPAPEPAAWNEAPRLGQTEEALDEVHETIDEIVCEIGGEVCRSAAGPCDVAERCTAGGGAPCPPDTFAPAGTACGAGACDDAVCTGQGRSCPPPRPSPLGKICREAVSVCDVTERCDGVSLSCPPDGSAPAGGVCRAAAGDCDVTESCTGSSPHCPPDAYRSASTQCRASAGICDVAESCTGSSPSCPPDGFASPFTLCRDLAGPCDSAEMCTGSSASCPPDEYASTATVCRGWQGDCDALEYCSGTSVTCPPDEYLPAGSTCRAATGICDVAESCSGSSPSCPPDQYLPPGSICRPAAGACDVAEACSGTSPACPGDSHLTGGICRPATGPCDQPEICNGSGPSCPPDAFRPSGVECRAAAGDCDVAESCSGASASCPADQLRPAGTQCRTAAGDCDVAESCSGASASCPADQLRPAGTQCRAAAGDCDVAESCSGASASCPADQLRPAGTQCRAAAGDCDVAESCTGASASCPADELQPDGTACDDGDACTEGDRCGEGTCVSGASVDCDDGYPCSVDACDPEIGCTHAPTDATAVCRPSAGGCDPAEACDGASFECPPDAYSLAGTPCRPSTGACDPAEECAGDDPSCPPDEILAAGTPCRTSAVACNPDELCDGSLGACPDDVDECTDEICDNGKDDDGDLDVDCDDADCIDDAVCDAIEFLCEDGVDNDSDGLIDCADPDCSGHPACLVTACDDVVTVRAGGGHTCILKPHGIAWCWGRSSAGQLARTTGDARLPAPTSLDPWAHEVRGVVDLALGDDFGCALRSDASVVCWGDNQSAQVGHPLVSHTPIAHRVSLPADARRIAAGARHACALLVNGTVWCWGDNASGQLGTPGPSRALPAQVPGVSGAALLAAGLGFTCAASAGDGRVACWGGNTSCELGIGVCGGSGIPPTEIAGLQGVVALAAGDRHACARVGDGLVCWGANEYGQLGDGSTEARPAPVPLALAGVTSFDAGRAHTCASLADGSVACWGANDRGQLGIGEVSPEPNPDPVVSALQEAAQVTAGGDHSYGLTAAGTLAGWGANADGQLAAPSPLDQPSPVGVPPCRARDLAPPARFDTCMLACAPSWVASARSCADACTDAACWASCHDGAVAAHGACAQCCAGAEDSSRVAYDQCIARGPVAFGACHDAAALGAEQASWLCASAPTETCAPDAADPGDGDPLPAESVFEERIEKLARMSRIPELRRARPLDPAVDLPPILASIYQELLTIPFQGQGGTLFGTIPVSSDDGRMLRLVIQGIDRRQLTMLRGYEQILAEYRAVLAQRVAQRATAAPAIVADAWSRVDQERHALQQLVYQLEPTMPVARVLQKTSHLWQAGDRRYFDAHVYLDRAIDPGLGKPSVVFLPTERTIKLHYLRALARVMVATSSDEAIHGAALQKDLEARDLIPPLTAADHLLAFFADDVQNPARFVGYYNGSITLRGGAVANGDECLLIPAACIVRGFTLGRAVGNYVGNAAFYVAIDGLARQLPARYRWVAPFAALALGYGATRFMAPVVPAVIRCVVGPATRELWNRVTQQLLDAGPMRWIATGQNPRGIQYVRGCSGGKAGSPTEGGGAGEALRILRGEPAGTGRCVKRVDNPSQLDDAIQTYGRGYGEPLAVQGRAPAGAFTEPPPFGSAHLTKGIDPATVTQVAIVLPRTTANATLVQWALSYRRFLQQVGRQPTAGTRGADFKAQFDDIMQRLEAAAPVCPTAGCKFYPAALEAQFGPELAALFARFL